LLDIATADGKQEQGSEAIYAEGKVNSKAEMRNGKPTGAWRCLVTEQFKLVLRGGPRQVAQFYDLQEDPFETNNLAADRQHAETRAELTDRLMAIRDQTSDSWPNVPAAAASMYSR
jgi:arylsulfatase A-like enzyme